MPGKFAEFDWENELYPAPRIRIKLPTKTVLHPGDIVRVGIGPAIGRIGIVTVERNGNYEDAEPYVSDESIAVRVAENVGGDPVLAEIIEGLTGRDNKIKTVLRWFDHPGQLTILQTSGQ